MALNPNTIKSLFGKLAPYADDAAKGVANYGDDAARLIGKYGDDVVPTYADDAAEWIIKGKPIHEVPEGALWTPQNRLKDTLVAKRTGRDSIWEPWEFRNGTDVSHLGNAIERFTYDNRPIYDFGAASVRTPHLPTEQLVYSKGELRPHKNTALGRWYNSKMRDRASMLNNMPDFEAVDASMPFKNADDYYEMLNHLDDSDMVRRVEDMVSGGPSVDVSDAIRYAQRIPNLQYVNPDALDSLYEILSKHNNTSRTLKNMFGRAPSSFPSSESLEAAMAAIADEKSKLPF